MRQNMGNIVLKTFSRLMLAFALTAIIPAAASAQEYESTPVTISKDKVRVDGQICYSHVVLERQTLFSISKAYNVSVDEIYRLNPSLKETGLKKNAIILIPAVQEKNVAAAMQDNALRLQQERQDRQKQLDSLTSIKVQKPSKKQTVHVRKWFEDLNSIAERYEVTPEAIMQANNLKSPKLSNRQKLIIPDGEMPEQEYPSDENTLPAKSSFFV